MISGLYTSAKRVKRLQVRHGEWWFWIRSDTLMVGSIARFWWCRADGRFELDTSEVLRSWWKGVTTTSARDTSFLRIWVETYVASVTTQDAYNLRNANDYYLTQPRTELFKKSTFYALPSAWNALSQDIKLHENRITLDNLQAHLMEELL